MKNNIISLLIMAAIFLSPQFFATAAEAPAAAPATFYELRNLQANGISFYASAPANRKYLQFVNADGRHHIIYEESPGLAPLVEAVNLQQAMGNLNAVCSVDLECAQKAFCTGDCKHMYYEVSNLPKEQIPSDHNRCRIQSFSCEKSAAAVAFTPMEAARSPASAAPVSVPAPVPGAAAGGVKVNVPGVPSFTVPPPPPLNMEE